MLIKGFLSGLHKKREKTFSKKYYSIRKANETNSKIEKKDFVFWKLDLKTFLALIKLDFFVQNIFKFWGRK